MEFWRRKMWKSWKRRRKGGKEKIFFLTRKISFPPFLCTYTHTTLLSFGRSLTHAHIKKNIHRNSFTHAKEWKFNGKLFVFSNFHFDPNFLSSLSRAFVDEEMWTLHTTINDVNLRKRKVCLLGDISNPFFVVIVVGGKQINTTLWENFSLYHRECVCVRV
jgi:hypothetical protein